MRKILCVIPSRIGSTRLSRKPLLPIAGKPMIQMVYENAISCDLFAKVIVATDSLEIAEVIQKINGEVLLTDQELQTGSDRVAVVAEKFPAFEVVVNLQGDEPFIKMPMFQQLLQPFLEGQTINMTTLARHLEPAAHTDPGVVKVITDLNFNALYFSRAPIPYIREPGIALPVYHHIGLYAFSRDFLLQYTKLSPTPLQRIEALEQLRVLEHGYKIKVCLTNYKTLEINTAEEYALAQNFN